MMCTTSTYHIADTCILSWLDPLLGAVCCLPLQMSCFDFLEILRDSNNNMTRFKRPQVSDNKLYEVKTSPSKGNGVFATRAISAGTIVMKDKVAITIKKDPPTIQPVDVDKAVSALHTADQERFFALHEGSRPYSSRAFRIYKANAFGSEGEGVSTLTSRSSTTPATQTVPSTLSNSTKTTTSSIHLHSSPPRTSRRTLS